MNKAERTLRRRLPDVWRHARDNDWSVLNERNGRGHIVLVHRSGRKATAPSTASDFRTQKNTVSWMRQIERSL